MDPSQFVSREKIRNLISRYGQNLEKIHLGNTGIKVLGFDGTRSGVLLGNGQMDKAIEKMTVICQIQQMYYDHFVLKKGVGETGAEKIFEGVFQVL